MSNGLDKYYELLGVAPGASAHDLKEAYRDMAKVWHPDRFSHDPRLQQKAQEKLKEINEAYVQLTNAKAGSRTRTAPAHASPSAPRAEDVRAKRPRLLLLAALVFCAIFFAALFMLARPGAHGRGEQTPPTEQAARPAGDLKQQEGAAGPHAAQTARGKEQTGRRPSAEAASEGPQGAAAGSQQLRPLATTTVTIDVATRLLATKDCPAVGRMTYLAGDEPRQSCDAPHKTKAGARDSRIKTVGKSVAAPVRWLGGGKGREAGEIREARTDGDKRQ